MNNIILDESGLNFNSIEKKIFEVVCKIGLSRIRVIMENVDNLIFESGDTKKYRYKFKREKTIQTIMGNLTFSRGYYIDKYNNPGVFLLDDTLSLNLIGRISENLIEKIIDNAIDNSYRKSAEKIEK